MFALNDRCWTKCFSFVKHVDLCLPLEYISFSNFHIISCACIFYNINVFSSVWVARRPPGYAFIDFDDRRDAQDAIRDLDGLIWNFNFSLLPANVSKLTTFDETSRTLTSCTHNELKSLFYFEFLFPPAPSFKPKQKKLSCSFIFNQHLSVTLLLWSLV